MKHIAPLLIIISILALAGVLWATPQQQVSGGGAVVLSPGTNLVGKVGFDQTTPGTTNAISVSQIGATTVSTGNGTVGAGVQRVAIASDNTAFAVNATVSGSIANTAFGVSGGVANIGIVRSAPSPCTQSTNFTNSTVGVATGAGTSVTSTTTCVTKIYVNNITNSAVTFRLQDKTGTPIIWIGGNADYTIPANSNTSYPLEGVLFTGGITAIAGTGSALNLQVSGLQ